MTSRESILNKVRTALGRSAGQPVDALPPLALNFTADPVDDRVANFRRSLELLAGKTYRTANPAEARSCVERILEGRAAVASSSPFLAVCGIGSLAGVRTGIANPDDLRAACAEAPVGITSADFALADTGSLVMIASPSEPRLVSLLPPVHVAVLPSSRILTGLEELFTVLPDPASQSSSMVLITGPSRTADIEQILVRGVHGPGEIHVVIVDSET